MKQKKKKNGKTVLTVIKNWLSLEDWRATLAVIVTVGGLIIIFWSLQYGKDTIVAVVPSVAALMTIVLDHYFAHKERES